MHGLQSSAPKTRCGHLDPRRTAGHPRRHQYPPPPLRRAGDKKGVDPHLNSHILLYSRWSTYSRVSARNVWEGNPKGSGSSPPEFFFGWKSVISTEIVFLPTKNRVRNWPSRLNYLGRTSSVSLGLSIIRKDKWFFLERTSGFFNQLSDKTSGPLVRFRTLPPFSFEWTSPPPPAETLYLAQFTTHITRNA